MKPPRTVGRGLLLVAHPSADLYGSDRVLLESISGLVEDGRRVMVTVPGSGPLVAEFLGRGAGVAACPKRSPALCRRAVPGMVEEMVSR